MDYTYQIRLRRGTASQWDLANPILASGEPGYITDTNQYKIGDGVTPWKQLPIATGIPGESASIDAGETETGLPGTAAQVTNVGTVQNAIFDFIIPEGLPGRDLVVYEGDKDDPPAEWTEQQFLWDPNGEIREELPLAEEESDRRYLSKVDHAGGILKEAVWWVDAGELTDEKDGLLDISGNGRDAMFGAGAAAPLVLPWDGEDYLWLTGEASSSLGIVGDIDAVLQNRVVITFRADLGEMEDAFQGALFGIGDYDGDETGYHLGITLFGSGRLALRSRDPQPSMTFYIRYISAGSFQFGKRWHRITKDGLDAFYEASDDGVEWAQHGETVTFPEGHEQTSFGGWNTRFGYTDGATGTSYPLSLYFASIEGDVSGTAYIIDPSNVTSDYSRIANTGTSGRYWTISRAATGFKTAVVDRPLILFGYEATQALRASGFSPSRVGTIIMAWRKWSSTSRNDSVSLSTSVATKGGLHISAGPSTPVQTVRLYSPGGISSPTGASVTLPAYGPNTFGTVSDGTTLKGILNGKVVGSQALSATDLFVSDAAQIGYANFAQDEFLAAAIFDRALTDEEIAEATDLLSGKRGPHPQYALKNELPVLSDEYPIAVGQYNNPGTSLEVARADHIHAAPRPGEWETASTWAALPSSGNWPGRKVHVLDGLGLCLAVWDGAGWQVDAQSDTGWLPTTALEPFSLVGGNIRRVGSRVEFIYLRLDANGGTGHALVLPLSFCQVPPGNTIQATVSDHNGAAGALRLTSGQVTFVGTGATSALSSYRNPSWHSDASWPTTPPA